MVSIVVEPSLKGLAADCPKKIFRSFQQLKGF